VNSNPIFAAYNSDMSKTTKKRRAAPARRKPVLGKRARALFDEAIEMPRAQRLRLAESLLDTLDPPDVLEAAWDNEIGRRIADIDSGRVKLIPHDEAMGLIFRRRRDKRSS
jgi:putative addiction module component (TIGR02574 family)